MLTGDQVGAARKLLGWSVARLASRAAVSDETIRKLESGRHRPGDDIVASIQHAFEAVGVEFTNGGEHGVNMRAMKLCDAGENSFANDTVSKWVGFGALDGVRPIAVLVEDLALARLDPTITGGESHRRALQKHRQRLLLLADRKYQRGDVEQGNIVRVLFADVEAAPA
jgi:transcriptional regulator with XRE-family HTH domain